MVSDESPILPEPEALKPVAPPDPVAVQLSELMAGFQTHLSTGRTS